jgi:hypothetical protein
MKNVGLALWAWDFGFGTLDFQVQRSKYQVPSAKFFRFYDSRFTIYYLHSMHA